MFERGGLVVLAVLVLYVWLAPPYIVDGDNAELTTLGTIGGVAHPTGYPLYLMWLRAMSWLPAQSPAHAAAIATVILAAVQAYVLHAACRAWGARPTAASLAVAVFAAGPVVMRMHTQAEVFALNGLVAASILWLAAASGPLHGIARAIALGLVAGLGLSNHLTCIFLAPVGVLGVVRGIREANQPRVAVAAAVVGALALGLLPYCYLIVTPETQTSWGTHIDSLGAVARHFMRSDYGGAGYSGRGAGIAVATSLLAEVATLGRAWLWGPLMIGLCALGLRCVKRREGESRLAWGMLAMSVVLAGPLFAIKLRVEPTGLGLYAVERFQILPAMMLAVPVAMGLDMGWTFVTRKLPIGISVSAALGGLLTTLVFAAAAALSLPYLARVHTAAVEQAVKNMLRTLPADSLVIVALDQYTFGLGYLQTVLGERRDVAVISWPQAPLEGYRERVERVHHIHIGKTTTGLSSVDVAEQVLASGRPLFIDAWEINIAKAFPTYPSGILLRVLPRGSALPSIEEVFTINKALYEKFEFGYPFPDDDSDFATEIHSSYARTWLIIQDALAARGPREDLEYAVEMARALAPHR